MNRATLLASLALAAACSNAPANDHHNPLEHAAHAAPPPAHAPAPAPPPQSPTMDPQRFQQARDAFQQHAAQQLRAQPAQLKGLPVAPQTAHPTKFSNEFKRLEAYTDDKHRLRGWATPDGDFATPDHHLERLLQPHLPTAHLLADELAWATGPLQLLHISPESGIPRPSWEDRDGAHSMTFVLNQRQPGPGGAGGGPNRLSRWTLTFKDGAASLSHEPWTP
jgi:hypothetical protein